MAPGKRNGETVSPAKMVIGGSREGREAVKELYGDLLEGTGVTEVEDLYTAHEIAKNLGCDHRTSGNGRHIWSRVVSHGRGVGIKQQPYCTGF